MLPRVEIVHIDQVHVEVLAVTADGSTEPRILAPFRTGTIAFAAMLDERRIIAIAHWNNFTKRNHTTAIIDTLTGAILRQSTDDGDFLRDANFQLSKDRSRLYVDSGWRFQVKSTETTKIIARLDLLRADGAVVTYDDYFTKDENLNLVFHSAELEAEFKTVTHISYSSSYERQDGKLMLMGASDFVVDTNNWSAYTIAVSPDRRKANFRRSKSWVSLTGEAPLLVRGSDYPDEPNELCCGVVVEHWGPGQPDAPIRIVARLMNAEDLSACQPSWGNMQRAGPQQIRDAMETGNDDTRAQLMSGAVVKIFWEPEGQAYWLLFSDGGLRRIAANGTRGPLLFVARWAPVPLSEKAAGNGQRTRAVQFLNDVVMQFDGDRIVAGSIELGGYVDLDRMSLGQRSFGSVITTEEDGFFSVSRIETQRRALDAISYRVDVLSFTRNDVCQALNEIEERLNTGIDGLLWGRFESSEALVLRFAVAGAVMSEGGFFNRIAREKLAVVPELRSLILAFLSQVEQRGRDLPRNEAEDTEEDEGATSLGHAMRALALLDPDCLDVLRRFMTLRDAEHEGFLPSIVADYERRHGWKKPEQARFAVFAMLNRGDPRFDSFDFWRQAGASIPPEELAELIASELEHHSPHASWRKKLRQHYAAALLEDLKKSIDYRTKVTEHLTAAIARFALPPDET